MPSTTPAQQRLAQIELARKLRHKAPLTSMGEMSAEKLRHYTHLKKSPGRSRG